jgi:ornithine decarboxylase
MAEIKSESVADFIPESVADLLRNQHYSGLDETLDERIHYRIRTPRDSGRCGPVILAGPTCDSADILYRRHPYELPLDRIVGDTIDFLSAGAYTGSVAAVAFNGFPPIRTYIA